MSVLLQDEDSLRRLAAVGKMAAAMADHVRNPLNSAKLALAVLERRLQRTPGIAAATLDAASTVERELDRLEHIADDFLAFAESRALDMRPTALADVCRDVVRSLRAAADAVGVRLAVRLPDEPLEIVADGRRLASAITNVVRNAIEASAAGGVVTVEARRGDGRVEVAVNDTGPGLAAGEPVFEAFYSTKPFGTGLGLIVVQRILNDHGGRVAVSSRPGDTTFTLSVPSDR